MSNIWMWNHKFRLFGVLLGLAIPVLLYVSAAHGSTPDKSGYGFMFGCYLPVFVLGLPWSLAAAFAGSVVPCGDLIGIVASVCLNGYLVGWLIDVVVNNITRNGRDQNYDIYLRGLEAARQQSR